MSQAPGWYPDPTDASRTRFWDGQRWTEQAAPLAPTLPPGPLGPPPGPPGPPPVRPRPSTGGRGVVAGIVAVGAALVVGAAIVGAAVVATRDDGPERATPATLDGSALGDGDALEGGSTDGAGEAPAVTCPPSTTEPEVRLVWQDESGIHVVVVLHTTCEVDQVVADPDARFGLFVGDDYLVTGRFDLSGAPLALPAGGASGELELVFDGEADLAADLRTRVFLPSAQAEAGPGGFDLRYVVVCEPGSGGGPDATVGSEEGANLDGAASVGSSGPSPTEPLVPDADDDDAALAVLEQIHADTAAERAALSGPWVPQVSAKSLDDDATYDVFTGQTIVHSPAVFLDRFRAWEARYGGAVVLLRGSDFRSICGDSPSERCLGLWIVAVDAPAGSGEEVLRGWCAGEHLNEVDGMPITDSDQLNCFAKRYVAEDSPGTAFYGP